MRATIKLVSVVIMKPASGEETTRQRLDVICICIFFFLRLNETFLRSKRRIIHREQFKWNYIVFHRWRQTIHCESFQNVSPSRRQAKHRHLHLLITLFMSNCPFFSYCEHFVFISMPILTQYLPSDCVGVSCVTRKKHAKKNFFFLWMPLHIKKRATDQRNEHITFLCEQHIHYARFVHSPFDCWQVSTTRWFLHMKISRPIRSKCRFAIRKLNGQKKIVPKTQLFPCLSMYWSISHCDICNCTNDNHIHHVIFCWRLFSRRENVRSPYKWWRPRRRQ